MRGSAIAVVAAALAALGCAGEPQDDPPAPSTASESTLRLSARPRADAGRCAPGEYELRIASGRRALMRVSRPAERRGYAVLVALHGAGSGGAPGGLWAFRAAWDLPGLVIVAPAAAGSAWTLDSTDVRFVDRALQQALARCRADRRRIGIGGFSSGAGMALVLGLENGDLFRSVIVLSGGGSLPPERIGKPKLFVAHGALDGVIPVELGGDRIARELRAEGYDVTYVRFPGGHRVVPTIARRAVVSTLTR